MVRVIVAFGLVGFVATGAGCSNSLANVKAEHAKGGGTTRIYDASADEAWTASEKVLRGEGVEAIEEHKPEWYMLGHKDASLSKLQQGAYIGVWIAPDGADHSKVTVVTKREHVGDTMTGLTEGTFHEELTNQLSIRNSAAPAHVSPPPDH